MRRYRILLDCVKDTRPTSIIEVGTHNGDSAVAMCHWALRMTDQPVHYVGYDLFEDADEANHEAEQNGKGAGSYERASQRLTLLSVQNGGRLTFELVRGNTRDTLHGKPQKADLAFIDGGHSVETIRGDYEALAGCGVVVCDDCYDGDDTGSRFLLDDGWYVSPADHSAGIDIRIIARGWAPHEQTEVSDPEWRDSVAQLMQENKAGTVFEWGSGPPKCADCLVAVAGWEGVPDVRHTLVTMAQFARKVAFFAFPVTAERGVAHYEAALEGVWRVIDRVEAPDAFYVSVEPYIEVPEVVTKGAGPDEERLANARTNIKAVKRRVMLPVQAHGRRVILACYGPSLQDTWQGIADLAKAGDADVVSTSAAHDFLLERGIVPDYHVDSDPRAHKAKHITKPNRATQYLLASCVHPVLVNKLLKRTANVALWHSYEGEWSGVIASEYDVAAFPDGAPMVLGGSNAGLRACMLFYALGYRHFDIFGMDCSFTEDGAQHAGKHAGKRSQTQPFFCDGKRFISSMLHAAYARQFMDMRRLLPDVHWRLYGEGLLQTMAAAVAKEERPVAKEAA